MQQVIESKMTAKPSDASKPVDIHMSTGSGRTRHQSGSSLGNTEGQAHSVGSVTVSKLQWNLSLWSPR